MMVYKVLYVFLFADMTECEENPMDSTEQPLKLRIEFNNVPGYRSYTKIHSIFIYYSKQWKMKLKHYFIIFENTKYLEINLTKGV